MISREQLEQVKKLDYEINLKLLRLQSLKELATSIGVNLKEVVVQSSGQKDKVSSCVVRIIELEEEINKLTDHFVYTKENILSEMENVLGIHSNEYRVLYMRFFEYKTRARVAVELGYNVESIRLITNKGLKKLSES